MRRRSCALLTVAALTWICAASAASVRIVIRPVAPVAGTKATIEEHAKLKAPVYAFVRSPNNAARRVRLRYVSKVVWRGAFTFPYSGLWTVRVRGASKDVLVQSQLAAPIPASTFVPLGEPGCTPPSPANATTGEARAAARIGDLWAVGFLTTLAEPKAAVLRDVIGKKTKIVWRMRGSGDATFTAIAPDDSPVLPTDVLRHGWSTWNRPGDEWGSIFAFNQPGCWQIHVERADNEGDLWLLVLS